MPHAADHSIDAARSCAELMPRRRPWSTTLSDHQAVVVVMAANGRTCEDIAADLFLPVWVIQEHLDRATKSLGLSSVEKLTPTAVVWHSTADPPAATAPSPSPRPGSFIEGAWVCSPVVSGAAEAARNADQEAAERDTLTRELAATRALLQRVTDKVQQLQEAVVSRDSIGQAKGILMERHKIGAEQAFAILQDQSSRTNRKLVHVAEHLVYSGGEGGQV